MKYQGGNRIRRDKLRQQMSNIRFYGFLRTQTASENYPDISNGRK